MSKNNGVSPEEFNVLHATGARIKLLRELAGLSQRELAKRAGVTNSSISTIELGQVSPSIQSLARILHALPISLPDFFRLLPDAITVSSPSASPDFHTSTITLPANYSGVFVVAPSDLSGVVLEGVLTLVLLDGANPIRAHEPFHVPSGGLFRLANCSAAELRLFICSRFHLPI